MSTRLVLASVAGVAMLAATALAEAPPAKAMPVAVPIATASPDSVTPGSGLIEQAFWRGGWGWRRRWCYWHPYRCGGY